MGSVLVFRSSGLGPNAGQGHWLVRLSKMLSRSTLFYTP